MLSPRPTGVFILSLAACTIDTGGATNLVERENNAIGAVHVC